MGNGLMRDLGSLCEFTGHTFIKLSDSTGDITSAAVDTNNCRGIRLVGELHNRNTTGTLAVKLTESATSGGSYGDVTSATTGTLSTEAAFEADWSGLNSKRYVKVVMTGAVAAIDASCLLVLHDHQLSPNPL